MNRIERWRMLYIAMEGRAYRVLRLRMDSPRTETASRRAAIMRYVTY